jgi:hypothetical protein
MLLTTARNARAIGIESDALPRITLRRTDGSAMNRALYDISILQIRFYSHFSRLHRDLEDGTGLMDTMRC